MSPVPGEPRMLLKKILLAVLFVIVAILFWRYGIVKR